MLQKKYAQAGNIQGKNTGVISRLRGRLVSSCYCSFCLLSLTDVLATYNSLSLQDTFDLEVLKGEKNYKDELVLDGDMTNCQIVKQTLCGIFQ